jgi:hypothetical protein
MAHRDNMFKRTFTYCQPIRAISIFDTNVAKNEIKSLKFRSPILRLDFCLMPFSPLLFSDQ